MVNCLVSTLKAVVNDDTMLRAGEFAAIINFPPKVWGVVVINLNTEGYVRVPDSSDLKMAQSEGGNKMSIISCKKGNNEIYFYNETDEAKDYYLYCSNKKELIRISPNNSSNTIGFMPKSTCYAKQNSDIMPLLDNWPVGGQGEGTILDFIGFKDKIKVITIKEQGNPTLSDYAQFKKLQSIDLKKEVKGDISILGSMIELKNLAFGKSSCSGTIESLIQSMRSHGRTTGSMAGNSSNSSSVTFNGSTDNAKGTVTWTETQITMNGITVDA